MPQSIPTREAFWNISDHYIMYLLLIATLAIFGWGFYKRLQLWRMGKPENRFDNIGQRIIAVLKNGLAHTRLLKEIYPGSMHLAISLGFFLLFLGTVIVSIDYDIWGLIFRQESFLKGSFYLYFSLILDIAGVLAIIGIVVAILRRYVQKPTRLDNRLDDAVLLFGLLFIIIGGYLVEGSRIAASHPSWAIWSPVGLWISGLFSGLSTDQIRWWHMISWWVHVVTSFGFIAYIPFSKLFHIISSPLNIYFCSFKPKGALTSIDIETEETFGVSRISDFTWKNLLDFDGCTRCGRCQDNCPAYLSEKPLSPKKFILDLLADMNDKGKHKHDNSEGSVAPLVGTAIAAEEIWACTTCRGCMEACPVLIEHIDKIIDLRRELVLMESNFPSELQQTFRGMENNFNPWSIGSSTRADWAKGLEIKNAAADKDIEFLWFVGCAGSYDDRVKKVSHAFAGLLQTAGVNFGFLGAEEKCCGETARRLGNEYLAQTLMAMNVARFNELGIKKIITFCPHCYNTFKNEYPQFGGQFEVQHHTEFLHDLIKGGQIKLKSGLAQMKVCYHDSCFLGRYNDIYTEPRKILTSVSGVTLIEMDKNLARSFCCGAGGGRMWLEEHQGQRINELRTAQALEKGPDAIATACPYCLTMIDDALKAKDMHESVKNLDIAEFIFHAMQR